MEKYLHLLSRGDKIGLTLIRLREGANKSLI